MDNFKFILIEDKLIRIDAIKCIGLVGNTLVVSYMDGTEFRHEYGTYEEARDFMRFLTEKLANEIY